MNQIMPPAVPSADSEPFESGSVYQALREDILAGRLLANERLVVSALAARYGTSTNPIREALQQLRGEGYVVFSHNRGARVRTIDEEFVRDIYEMEVLIEPYLAGAFANLATEADIARLEAVQDESEALNFADATRNSALDSAFHRIIYDHHYNRHAVEMWWKHREILAAISRNFPISLSRRKAIVAEHRALIAALKQHDAAAAAAIVAGHVRGAGQHIVEQMRAARHRQPD